MAHRIPQTAGSLLTERNALRAVTAIALCAAAIALFFTAQAIRYESVAARERAAIRAMDQIPGAGAELRVIAAYAAHAPARDPLRVAIEALSILDQFGLEPLALRVDEQSLTVEVARRGRNLSADDLAQALESDQTIANVRQQVSARDDITLVADLESAP